MNPNVPKRIRYYFQKYDESCYTLDYHLEYMEEHNLETLDVYEAKVEYGTGYFFCKHFDEVDEVGRSCGKICDAYRPRNGKSGICTHHGNIYERTDIKITLTRKRK